MTDFPKPLGEWIDEKVQIPAYEAVFNSKGEMEGIKQSTVERSVKTIYTKLGNAKRFSCNDGEHSWFMSDKHRAIASCKQCMKNRFLRAVYEQILDGHIVDRDTKELID